MTTQQMARRRAKDNELQQSSVGRFEVVRSRWRAGSSAGDRDWVTLVAVVHGGEVVWLRTRHLSTLQRASWWLAIEGEEAAAVAEALEALAREAAAAGQDWRQVLRGDTGQVPCCPAGRRA